jgi:hypothetical protein
LESEEENSKIMYLRVHISAIYEYDRIVMQSLKACIQYILSRRHYSMKIKIDLLSIGSPSLKDGSSFVYQSDDTKWLAGGSH